MNRANYRALLTDKLLGLEDEGYGDFDYSDAEKNTYLELAVVRLYPALYKRVSLAAQTPAVYGNSRYGSIATTFADRVFLVEDAAENEPIFGWFQGVDKILGVNVDDYPSVNLYYIDAYDLAADDTTDVGIPNVWTPVIVLGALIEALESRHDTGVRDDGQLTGHQETQLIDRLYARYTSARDELAMSLPAVNI